MLKIQVHYKGDHPHLISSRFVGTGHNLGKGKDYQIQVRWKENKK